MTEELRDQAGNAPVASSLRTPALNKALAAFQAELPKIAKDATGEIRGTTKEGKPYSYTFDYASLENVSDETLPALGRKGLALMGAINSDDQGRIVYDYWLLHESGEERGPFRLPLWLLLPERFTAQTIGGYASYARRYAIGPVTGVAPGGQDIDAHGAEESAGSGRGGAWMNRRPDVPPRDLQDKRTPAAVTGSEHEQLRDGTVEATPGDRPAKRLKTWEEQGADPWLDQPPGTYDERPPEELPGSMTEPQRRRLFQAFADLGISRPSEQRDVLSDITKRQISSRKDLSLVEMDATVLPDLDARVEAKQATQAALAAAAGQDAAEVDAP